MKLTTKSEYSLLALIYLAREERDSFVKIETICKEHTISKKYLEQLLTLLIRRGFIVAKRGAHGGYALAKPANKITIASIIRLMDGALAPTESVSTFFFAHTPLEKEKKILKVMKSIRDDIARRLEKLTLADLI